MSLVQIVAPLKEPLSIADAKSFMRIIDNDDDTLIENMIIASREFAESYTNRQFDVATFELICENIFQDMPLPKNPIQSIEKIEYLDNSNVYQTLSDDNYYLFTEHTVSNIHFDNIPTFKAHKNAIKITFISGYTSVPKSLIAWLKIKVSTLYENREQFVIGVSINEFSDKLVDSMLDILRVRTV